MCGFKNLQISFSNQTIYHFGKILRFGKLRAWMQYNPEKDYFSANIYFKSRNVQRTAENEQRCPTKSSLFIRKGLLFSWASLFIFGSSLYVTAVAFFGCDSICKITVISRQKLGAPIFMQHSESEESHRQPFQCAVCSIKNVTKVEIQQPFNAMQ